MNNEIKLNKKEREKVQLNSKELPDSNVRTLIQKILF